MITLASFSSVQRYITSIAELEFGTLKTEELSMEEVRTVG